MLKKIDDIKIDNMEFEVLGKRVKEYISGESKSYLFYLVYNFVLDDIVILSKCLWLDVKINRGFVFI